MNECVLCDWIFDPLAPPIAVYLSQDDIGTPLRWPDTSVAPRTCAWSDSIAETILEVALVAHWGRKHPDQLTGALGHDYWALRPM